MFMCLALACQKKDQKPQVEETRFYAEVARRASKAVDSKTVTARIEAVVDDFGTSPEIAKAGKELMGAVGSAPALTKLFSEVTTAFGKSAKVQAAMRKLRQEQPSLNDEQFVKAFTGLVERNTESKAFNDGFETEFGKLVDKPDVNRVFEKFGEQVSSSPYIQEAINGSLRKHILEGDWGKRLTKLNGGDSPNPARSTDLLLEHIFTPKRLQAFYVEVFSGVATVGHVRGAVADLLRAPSFRGHVVKALATILGDPVFRQDCVSAMEVLIEKSPTKNQVAAAVRKLTEHPLTQKAMVKLVDSIVSDPEMKKIGDKALQNISRDPAVRKAILKLMNDW